MSRALTHLAVILTAATFTATMLALVTTGCGSGGGGGNLADCGNGRFDDGEACDDGNLVDNDACLSTCENAVCGDGFLNQPVEQCEIGLIPSGSTCQTEGFQTGTLACNTTCDFDTSGCSGSGGATPTPITSPTPGGSTATGANATATPTAQPTPVGATCDGSESIVVTLSLARHVTSARLVLGYGTSVNLPGSGTDPGLKARVDFAGSGLTVVNDFDDDGDLIDDTLTASLVGTDVVPAGTFATVTFDCVAGQPSPSIGDFDCTVTSASLQGTSVASSCAVRIE